MGHNGNYIKDSCCKHEVVLDQVCVRCLVALDMHKAAGELSHHEALFGEKDRKDVNTVVDMVFQLVNRGL